MEYETKTMTFAKALTFMKFYDAKIGTERSMETDSSSDEGKKYFFCVDLIPTDINNLRKWENENQAIE